MILRCPACGREIIAEVRISDPSAKEGESQKLLDEWLGMAHWGSLQLSWMNERIALHGERTVRLAVERAVRHGGRTWAYLDAVIRNGDLGGVQSSGNMPVLDFPPSAGNNLLKDSDSASVQEITDLF